MQDIKGKEAYLKMMDEHWVNFSPIVGIIIIFFGAYVYFKASARVKKRFKSLYHIAPIKVTPNKK